MAFDKIVDSVFLEAGLKKVGDSIRAKAGTSELLEFPDAMSAAVDAIDTSENLDDALDDQESLIDQIQAALEGKAAGGSGTAQGAIIFNINDGQLTLNKMRLTSGAQVVVYGGNLTMTNCDFDASTINPSGGEITCTNCDFDASTIDQQGSILTLTGCTFSHGSNMIQWIGYITMTDCVFTDCQVQLGDYYEAGGMILTFTNCHFNNCSLEYTDEAYAALVAGGNYIDGALIT